MARKVSRRTAANLKAAARLGQVTNEEIARRKAEAKLERARLRAEEKRLRAEEPTAEQRAREAEKARIAAQTEVAKEELRKRMAGRRARGQDDDAFPMLARTARAQVRAAGAELAAERDYIARTDSDGRIRREYLTPPHEPAKPKPAEPVEEPPAPAESGDPRPIWLKEQRQPTREEWQAHQRARCPAVGAAYIVPEFAGNGTGHFSRTGELPISRRWSQNL